MKHVIMPSSLKWGFSERPLPAYHIRDTEEFLAVKGFSFKAEENSIPVLPEGKFRVARTKQGTTLIVSGEDDSKRCLLFFDYGEESVVTLESTGIVLKTFPEGMDVGKSIISVAAVLDEGQRITLRTRSGTAILYEWDGSNARRFKLPWKQWEEMRDIETSAPDEIRIL